ncbi:MAG: phosphotransferase [Candidatus Dormibacteria bacterium]
MAALPDRLAAQIAHTFPTLQWNRAQLLDHGWDHEVVILDSTLVLRFPRTSEYQERLHDEIRLLDVLTPLLHVRIPKYTRSAASVAGYTIVHGIGTPA